MFFLDGGIGTELAARGVAISSLRDGCVVLQQPGIVREIHEAYLHAGADIISTCTFMAQDAETADTVNRAAVAIARQAIAKYRAESNSDRPILIAGSVGPTQGEPESDISPEIYIPQMAALIDSGVDALLIETIVDPRYCRAAILAAREAMVRSRRTVKVMLSASVSDSKGFLPCGIAAEQMLSDAASLCASLAIDQTPFPLFSVGLNCSTGPRCMTEPLRRIRAAIRNPEILLSAHPNAGFPDADGRYAMTPDQFAAEMAQLARSVPLDIAGGCCGTTPQHILRTKDYLQGTRD